MCKFVYLPSGMNYCEVNKNHIQIVDIERLNGIFYRILEYNLRHFGEGECQHNEYLIYNNNNPSMNVCEFVYLHSILI